MKKNFTIKSIYKLAWPAIISHATVMFISIIDLTFIAKLQVATVAIAATAIANNICAAIYAFLEGLRSGTTVLVARFSGANRENDISKVINVALLSALLIGIILAIIAPVASFLLYSHIGKAEITKLGYPYLTIRLMGLPFHLIIFSIIGTFRGLKNTFYPFIITISTCFANILFNYAFTSGIFGLPQLSMKSIALATAIAYFLGAALSFIFLLKTPTSKKYINFKARLKLKHKGFFKHFRKTDKKILKSFVKLVTEIGLYAGVLVLAFFVFISMFTALGPKNFTAHQIVMQVFLATYLPPMGFFVASAIIIGKILGEKQGHLVIPVTRKIWLSSLPIVGSIASLAAVFARPIAIFFSRGDPEIISVTVPSIYLVCAAQLLSSAYLVVKGSLTAAKDTRFVFIVGTMTSYLFFLPLSYILGIWLNYGVSGGYIAFLSWTALDMTVFSIRLIVGKPWGWINSN